MRRTWFRRDDPTVVCVLVPDTVGSIALRHAKETGIEESHKHLNRMVEEVQSEEPAQLARGRAELFHRPNPQNR